MDISEFIPGSFFFPVTQELPDIPSVLLFCEEYWGDDPPEVVAIFELLPEGEQDELVSNLAGHIAAAIDEKYGKRCCNAQLTFDQEGELSDAAIRDHHVLIDHLEIEKHSIIFLCNGRYCPSREEVQGIVQPRYFLGGGATFELN